MASNRIKGITIQIGATTTELTKALKDVNSIISKSNAELKDLNRALKLDPKNTELLAQKQQVLRDNIQASNERLATLKEALRQMDAKGIDNTNESYRALQREIITSENAIRNMNEELKATSKIDLSKLKEGLKKVGEVAVQVSKKLLQVSSAVGGALASIVGLGVKSYASLEQNIGGIQKLFGKSADDLVAKSKEAYKTAGISANQYMETATSFSASLLKGLSGNTKQAVALTDRAIKDMSDNANTFGSSMEEVMNVYKALSKEQYTTLDNLRLGYAGTKTGAKQLVKDASAYAKAHKELGIQVNANSLEFNNLINAISVMQKKMGISGTTMKEAEGTIQGSINTLKASFDNFLNGSGSPEALSESVLNVLKNISGAITKLAPNILKGLVDLLKTLLPQVGKILMDLLPQLIDSVNSMIDSLYTYFISNTSGLEKAIGTLITKIVLFITENLPKILDIAIKLVVALANGISSSLDKIIPPVIKAIGVIITTITDNLDLIIDSAITLILALVDGLLSDKSMNALIDAVPTIIEKLIEALIKNAPKIAEMGLKLIYKLVEGILRYLPQMPDLAFKVIKAFGDGIYYALPEVLNRANDIIETIKKKLGELPDKAINWGRDMIDGLVKGIKGAIGKVKDAVKGVANTISNFLHFSRPDEGALRDYETWMPDFIKGLANGIRKSSYILEDASLGLANDMSSSILGSTSRALRGLKGGINNSLNPSINPTYSYDLNYKMMASAMKEALNGMNVELDDREVGKFIDKQVSEEVYS